MKRSITTITAGVCALALVAGACGSDDAATDDTAAVTTTGDDPVPDTLPEPVDEADTTVADGGEPASTDCESTDSVSLQLQWFTQAQFGGYYAAIDQGFYADQCLEVEIKEGAVEIVPQAELASGNADFAIAWVPKALQTREAGADIVNIAQVFERSGTLQVSFADTGITSPADFAGKTIGNWGFGNEYEVFAAIGEAGLDPATDVTLVGQQFDMIALLEGDIDAAEAMTYNEYAQVLEAINPDTGELYQPEDFNVISYEEEGVGMLQDAIWADAGAPRRRSRLPRCRRAVRRGVAAGLGVLPRQRRAVRDDRHRRRLDARREPPAVDDERGQQADLAGVGCQHRPHRPGRLGPDGRDQPEHAEPRGCHRAHRGSR